MVDVLPYDVSLIVYRYLFEYDYSRVRLEYSDRWIVGKRMDSIYWNDNRDCFGVRSYVLMRFVPLIQYRHHKRYIHNFYSGAITGTLPMSL